MSAGFTFNGFVPSFIIEGGKQLISVMRRQKGGDEMEVDETAYKLFLAEIGRRDGYEIATTTALMLGRRSYLRYKHDRGFDFLDVKTLKVGCSMSQVTKVVDSDGDLEGFFIPLDQEQLIKNDVVDAFVHDGEQKVDIRSFIPMDFYPDNGGKDRNMTYESWQDYMDISVGDQSLMKLEYAEDKDIPLPLLDVMLEKTEAILGFRLHNKYWPLMVDAMTHKSTVNNYIQENMALGGDKLAAYYVSWALLRNFGVDHNLTLQIARFQSNSAWLIHAKFVDLGKGMIVGGGLERISDAMLSTTFEALIYLAYEVGERFALMSMHKKWGFYDKDIDKNQERVGMVVYDKFGELGEFSRLKISDFEGKEEE